MRTAAAALILGALAYGGARPIGPLPPLGGFFDPLSGMWAVARDADLPETATATVPGLRREVRVVYDVRGVPHIFAATEEDAYRALGYVVARDRLFQLEVQARAAAGTLTELVGPRALPLDRDARRLGLPRAAAQKAAALDPMGPAARALRAYADGVNARIADLGAFALPIEYRLLGARPAVWRAENTFHLLNRMALTLAVKDPERRRALTDRRVGRRAADALFPRNNPIQQPIEPTGEADPRYDFGRLPPPGPPDRSEDAAATVAALTGDGGPPPAEAGDALGSNNWAVAPARTRNGFALLAGDPHLTLTLPSLWYEVHLVVPGTLDVYGATIPGAPFVVIGFNRDVAWTFTNAESDVMDFYRERVDDDRRPTQYRVDGRDHSVASRVEEFRDQRGRLLAIDTVRFTHRGPLLRTGQAWVSMRWTALEPSGEIDAFLAGAHATTAERWLDAMASYAVPAQNMLVADRTGTIAIRQVGRVPVRPPGADPTRVQDGSVSAADWRQDVPIARLPQSVRPDQGFLVSANQQPVDPRHATDYLGADWPAPWRAMRINQLLRADSAVTPDAMRRYQTDLRGPRAAFFAPFFVTAARARGACAGGRRGTGVCDAAAYLAQWDLRYAAEDRHAALFEEAMRELTVRAWSRLAPTAASPRSGRRTAPAETPAASTLADLLQDPDSPWWDDPATPQRETRDSALVASLLAAWDRLVGAAGPAGGEGWRWDQWQTVSIMHVLGIPTFSRQRLPPTGGPSTISPTSGDGRAGSSWRMVVEMGPRPSALTIYPGGQSGNPISARYADRLPKWVAGELDSVFVPDAAAALPRAATLARLVLRPPRP